MTKAILAFDLGGTNLKYGIGTPDGNIFYHSQRASGGMGAADEVIAAFTSAAEEMKELARRKRMHLVAVGVGTPGAVDLEKGSVFGSSPNMPSVIGISLKESLEREIGLPVVVDNDANLAILGEAVAGAGKDYKSVLGLTLGTGVGGGFVMDGRIFRGDHGSALEAGHTVIEMGGRICSCGKSGHLEAYASGTAIIKRTNELGLKFEEEKALSFSKTKPVFAAAEEGYEPAVTAVREAIVALGIGIANLINTFDPGCVVIGGGVMFGVLNHWGDLEHTIADHVTDSLTGKTPVLPAELGNMAGMVGAVIATAHKLGI